MHLVGGQMWAGLPAGQPVNCLGANPKLQLPAAKQISILALCIGSMKYLVKLNAKPRYLYRWYIRVNDFLSHFYPITMACSSFDFVIKQIRLYPT